MSRIGKKPIQISNKIQVIITGDSLSVKGPKGTLEKRLHPAVNVVVSDGVLTVDTVSKDRDTNALRGLFRALIANMVTGVTTGFNRILLLNGIGYRAEVSGKKIVLNLGYSNPVNFDIPEGITAQVEKNTQITLSGIDKEKLGETAARIRRLRPLEPYKGKGIMYSDERVIKKAGKAAAK
ncbi:MAG: 50S ribosomal protein L6 [Pseudomonadota bacterium]